MDEPGKAQPFRDRCACDAEYDNERIGALGVSVKKLHACPTCTELRKAKEKAEREERVAATRVAHSNRMEAARLKREETWQQICPPEFRTIEERGATDVERLLPHPRFEEVVSWEYNPTGLLLVGETRKCKTRIMWRLLRRMFDKGKMIQCLTASEFDRECRDAAGKFYLSSWFARLSTADVFFMDDLGKGAWTDFTDAQFFDLIDYRTKNHLPIMATCNYDGEVLSGLLKPGRGVPLVERLREYCDTVIF